MNCPDIIFRRRAQISQFVAEADFVPVQFNRSVEFKGEILKPSARPQYPIFPGFSIHLPRHGPKLAVIGQFAPTPGTGGDHSQTFVYADERAF